MNDTIKTQLEHRSIRKFKDEKIPEKIINTLIDVARRSPSSNGLQAYSIIRITDKKLKKQISEICAQSYIQTSSDLFIFISDQYRNNKIAEENKFENKNVDIDMFLQGVSDSLIAAQNMAVAAESLGLGTLFVGSIQKNVDRLISLLNLPKYTFPIMGLALGYKDMEPQLKPRLPKKIQIFENEYKKFENYTEAIKDFDKEMDKYVDLRMPDQTVGKFSLQVKNKHEFFSKHKKHFIASLKKQEFNID